MTDDTDLFTGTDSARSTPAAEADDGQFASRQNPLVAWASSLTTDEVHALTVGATPALVGLVLLPFTPEIALVPLVLSLAVLGAVVAHRRKETRLLRYLLRDSDYVVGGHIIASFAGTLWVGIVASVRLLVGVVA